MGEIYWEGLREYIFDSIISKKKGNKKKDIGRWRMVRRKVTDGGRRGEG